MGRNKGDMIQFSVPTGSREQIKIHAKSLGYANYSDYIRVLIETDSGLDLSTEIGNPNLLEYGYVNEVEKMFAEHAKKTRLELEAQHTAERAVMTVESFKLMDSFHKSVATLGDLKAGGKWGKITRDNNVRKSKASNYRLWIRDEKGNEKEYEGLTYNRLIKLVLGFSKPNEWLLR